MPIETLIIFGFMPSLKFLPTNKLSKWQCCISKLCSQLGLGLTPSFITNLKITSCSDMDVLVSQMVSHLCNNVNPLPFPHLHYPSAATHNAKYTGFYENKRPVYIWLALVNKMVIHYIHINKKYVLQSKFSAIKIITLSSI